ncbi:hypothetical protein V6615_15395 [Oscillospiraceae bacterium PP1C4]
MKKILAIILSVILLFTLSACNNTFSKAEESEIAQLLYDASEMSKEYITPIFEEKLVSQGIEDYTLIETAYGFITSETPQTIVAFMYSYHDITEMYGYKLNVKFDIISSMTPKEELKYSDIFSIEDESIEIAQIVFPK